MAVEVAVARRLFTRGEYHRMAEVGILKETDRVELIRGEIVQMSPQGFRHRAFIDNLTHLLATRIGDRAIVSIQMPVALSEDTEPEPDVQILRRGEVPYKNREVTAADALLVVEVAETSLAYDRSTKLRLYAAAGVPEYWIVDCAAEGVEVHRAPEADGYREVTRITGATATVAMQAFPDVALALHEIFA
ncbi:MAG TPA: Uma2 family endonuclease [Methylomirabilota bacterium]|nr:Uma2 family endonuclease [Methylomirabilota bacterium]